MPTPPDPPTNTLVFSPLATDFARTLSELRRSTLSIHNHLRSIAADADFVARAAEAYGRPLVANERCGSWYMPPAKKHASCYFKSTDGHPGQWGFSLRRLNLHLLDLIGAGDGLLAKKLQKPLRPLWITRDSVLPDEATTTTKPCFEDFHPIILCTASKRVTGQETHEEGYEFEYVQGAGDDCEGWSEGLTPSLYWTYQEQLLATPEDQLPLLISTLLHQSSSIITPEITVKPLTPLGPKSTIWLGTLDHISTCCQPSSSSAFYKIIICAPAPLPTSLPPGNQIIHLVCPEGNDKRGSRALRHELHKLGTLFFSSSSSSTPPPSSSKPLAILSPSANLALGIALALFCLYHNDDGDLLVNDDAAPAPPVLITKALVAKRLANWITIPFSSPSSSCHLPWTDGSPPSTLLSSDTLKAVRAFLMS